MEEIKLKPCPFCGSENAEIIQCQITKNFHVVCNSFGKCPMVIGIPAWSRTEQEAAELWNMRAEVSE